MTSQPTPRPWFIDLDSESGAVDIRCNDPKDGTAWGVATVWHQSGGSHDPERPMADAALIVRAVNHHDELVALVERSMGLLRASLQGSDLRTEPLVRECYEDLRTLLAKVKP